MARVIDLDGPEGNAFCLLGFAKDLCRQLDDKDYQTIHDEMTSSDYDHLVKTFVNEFGDYVTVVGQEQIGY